MREEHCCLVVIDADAAHILATLVEDGQVKLIPISAIINAAADLAACRTKRVIGAGLR